LKSHPNTMSKAPKTEVRPAPQLYLITPEIEDAADFARTLSDALGAADVAAVLLRLKTADERTLINRVKALLPAAQASEAALVLDGMPELVARSGADGAHLDGLESFIAANPPPVIHRHAHPCVLDNYRISFFRHGFLLFNPSRLARVDFNNASAVWPRLVTDAPSLPG
jgi:hypothetical protein